MELWIRSQNRENTVKIINQYGLKYNDNKTIIANYQPDFTDKYDGYYETLGTYNSKERALEVLDEIQKYLESGHIVLPTSNFGNINTTQLDVINKIYEMPKE
jgi:hypothetical protein